MPRRHSPNATVPTKSLSHIARNGLGPLSGQIRGQLMDALRRRSGAHIQRPSDGTHTSGTALGLGFRLCERIEHKETSLGATMWLKAYAVAHVIEQMFCGWPFFCLFFVRIAFVCFLKKKVYIGHFHGHTVFSREQLPSFTFFIHHFRVFFQGFLSFTVFALSRCSRVT